MKYFFLVLVLAFSSCQSVLNKTLDGTWSIDEIKFKGNNIKPCMDSKAIHFNTEDNSCSIPAHRGICENIPITYVSNGKFILSQRNRSMKIVTKNIVFDGVYQINFIKNTDRHVLQLEFSNDSLYFICSKFLYNFHENIADVNCLVDGNW